MGFIYYNSVNHSNEILKMVKRREKNKLVIWLKSLRTIESEKKMRRVFTVWCKWCFFSEWIFNKLKTLWLKLIFSLLSMCLFQLRSRVASFYIITMKFATHCASINNNINNKYFFYLHFLDTIYHSKSFTYGAKRRKN